MNDTGDGRRGAIRKLMDEHRALLNRLDPGLGCVTCRGPLDDPGVCPRCDGRPTRCLNCNGTGGDPQSITDDDPESSFYGQPTSACPVCDGTGRPFSERLNPPAPPPVVEPDPEGET